MRRHLLRFAAAMLVAAASNTAQAEEYPSRTVTILVPTAPGGAVDGMARLLAKELGKRFDQSFVVENRPGSGGILGMKLGAQAPNDGYTLVLSVDAFLAVSPYLLPKMPYQPQKDLAPVSLLGKLPFVLVTNPKTEISTVAQLVAKAKEKPERLTYASGGEGSLHHLAMELFLRATDIKLQHVPYKSAPQGFGDVVAGHIDMMFIATGTAAPLLKSGKLNAIGSTSNAPTADLPQVPALKDMVPGYTFEGWFAMFAPAGTPAERINKLETAFREALQLPHVREKFQSFGVIAEAGGPEVVSKLLARDTERYAPTVKEMKGRAR